MPRLALAIAPATPEAVRLLADERERHPVQCEFGPPPLVRQMLGLAMLSLVMLLAVSVFPEVNTVNMNKSLLELSGYPRSRSRPSWSQLRLSAPVSPIY